MCMFLVFTCVCVSECFLCLRGLRATLVPCLILFIYLIVCVFACECVVWYVVSLMNEHVSVMRIQIKVAFIHAFVRIIC
eukprot:m.86849 g.86849  ORF g.86849 m.86849 type:complete len:79 (+) comp8773_c0_seq3:13-249(+)